MFFDTVAQDLRIGLRVIVKERTFCALAVAVLAIGIAAVATQFAVVNGVLLRGFSFPNSERLVDVQLVDPTNFSPANFNAHVTGADYADLKAQQTSFGSLVAYINFSTINLTHNGTPVRLRGAYISWDFFRTLGVSPALGRDFTAEDDRPGVENAVILSDAIWQREFGGRADILGQSIRVNGRAGVIVGVMPPKFSFPANEQLWVPLNTEFPVRPRSDRNNQGVALLGRLKPGVSLEHANNEIATLARRYAELYPENQQFSLGWVRPLLGAFTGLQISNTLYLMLAFCVGVLLIACANVMNMQFARATLRAKELAIRSSLGATRIRLVRQMLSENLLLASLGAIVGIAAAFWATDWLDTTVHAQTFPIPDWMVFTIDLPVLAFVVGATFLSAILSGILPALLASRANASDALKDTGRGNSSRLANSVTRTLVVAQILVTCVLLIGSFLELQSILRQQHIDFGYDTDSVLTARMGLMEGDYPTSAARVAFYEKLLRELRTHPAIESVALSNRFQMLFTGTGPIEIEGRAYTQPGDRPLALFENISDGYFATTRQRLIEGRDFTPEDNDLRQPVAIVNATFAKKHFGTESPLGRRIRTVNNNGTTFEPWRTIVGVVSDTRLLAPFPNQNVSDNSGFYVPFTAFLFGGDGSPAVNGLQFATLIVRLRGDQRPETFDTELRRAVARVDPNLPLYFVSTPQTNLEGAIARNRLVASMFTIFGAVAVILASVGLYGVMSFAVNQRTQEFGIRMALGADARSILRMVLRQGSLQLALGLLLGLGFTYFITTYFNEPLRAQLFQTDPRDATTFLAVAALLTLVALAAMLVPARRATRVDPMSALRAD